MAKDFYKLLGVPRNAEEKDIKAAYRKLARKYHPDVNPNDKASEARFKEISEAYDVLSDPEKRQAYNQFGDQWEQAQHFGGFNPNDVSGGGYRFDTNVGGGGFETIFEQFLGGMRGGGSRVRLDFDDMDTMQPRDVEKVVEVSLEEVDQGTKRVLTYQTMDAQRTREGVSTVPTTKKVEVRIPAGISDGKKLRVPGKGAAGVNGKAGDLYVIVKWANHERFKPVGDNLEVEVPVLYTTAAMGGEVKVPTLRSSVTMKIPPGTQSGQTLRLGGQGITKLHGQRGDLMAKVKITVPKHIGDQEKKLLKQLAELHEGLKV